MTYRLMCHNCMNWFWSNTVQPACSRCREKPESAASFILTALCIVTALWILVPLLFR